MTVVLRYYGKNPLKIANIKRIYVSKKGEKNLIVGLDIGTSKVVAIVGEINENNQIEVIGIGTHPSRGLKKGVVVNIESTVHSIQKAVEEAELMAGCDIHSVYAGIAGSHIRSLNSHGIVAIQEKEVSSNDIDRVIDAARAVAIPTDQRILHILPQEFLIDSQEGILDPIGMSGIRMEAKVHMVTGAESAAQNITKCIQKCGLEVDDIVLEQLASSYAVLTEDEKELGSCLVDIGGGTTDIAVFQGGAIQHTAVIPIAGDQVTNDIAVSMRTPTHYAEDIKIKYACALSQLANPDETIEVPSVGDRPPRRLARQTLAEIVEPRFEELFSLIRNELRRSGFEESIPAGIVITGGSAKMEGAVELAEEVFHIPVRLGSPQYVEGLSDVVRNPIHATGVGLLIFGRDSMDKRNYNSVSIKNSLNDKIEKIKNWVQKQF
ncbi:MAG: cell division protein FtsA [Woeseiaceae bacterium]|jgi:cell division protein FtsA|tara:strand:- start:4210 stop:5514 length:1305 start_codon:yes stop_codon:yes gene_type:complete